MHELRVQVNHLYDPPYSPQIRWVRNLMNVLYPKWQQIYPLRKFQVPQFDFLSVAFSSIKAHPDFFKLPNSSCRGLLMFLKALFLRTSAPINVHIYFFLPPMPPHVLVDFVVLHHGHGSSVTDFWGCDAHEAQLRCPDYVIGDIGGWSARRALKPKFYKPTQTMVTAGILPFRENSHRRAGNLTRDLMISSQRLWPLDYEGRHIYKYF